MLILLVHPSRLPARSYCLSTLPGCLHAHTAHPPFPAACMLILLVHPSRLPARSYCSSTLPLHAEKACSECAIPTSIESGLPHYLYKDLHVKETLHHRPATCVLCRNCQHQTHPSIPHCVQHGLPPAAPYPCAGLLAA